MDCKEVQKKYIPFIDDLLNVKDLEAFLEHMNQCRDCREEYDVYYTMIMGMRYLEEDNFKGTDWVDSEKKLEYALDYLRKYRFLRLEKMVLLVILCVGCAVFL